MQCASAISKFPGQLKKKSVFFMKKAPGVQVSQKIEQDVIVGDLAGSQVEQLSLVLDNIYSPLIDNGKNVDQWSHVVGKDIKRHFSKLQGAAYSLSGKSKGKTFLPVPSTGSFPEGDPAALHVMEAAVIEWDTAIRLLLKSDSSAPIRDGLMIGPKFELDFWDNFCSNLQCVNEQMKGAKVTEIAEFLQTSKSNHHAILQNIIKDVADAFAEAQEIVELLSSLRPFVDQLSSPNEFTEVSSSAVGIFHSLSLVWKHTKYYNASRFSIFLEETCNEIVLQAASYLNPEEIFKMEIPEAVEKLKEVQKLCNLVHSTLKYYEEKSKADGKAWNIDKRHILKNFENFELRVYKMMELFEIMVDFSKLEKIEIGGTKGRALTHQIVTIFTEFTAASEYFKKLKYNPLNMKIRDFEVDLAKFHAKLDDLDKRLATIISVAFDDCSGSQSCIRLLEVFGGLLNRPAIHVLFESRFKFLIEEFETDIQDVKKIFLAGKENPPIHPNRAPVSGAIAWTHELKERISKTKDRLFAINPRFVESSNAAALNLKYDELYSILDKFEKGLFEKWGRDIVDQSEANLSKPLYTKDDNGLIRVNFDPKVVALLKEVRYLNFMNITVPEKAKNIFAKQEVYRSFILRLDHIARQYNSFKTTMLDVEKPLVAARVQAIDSMCDKALTSIDWRNQDAEKFISELSVTVGQLTQTLQVTKNSLSQIENFTKNWFASPILERKDQKKQLNLEEKQAKLRVIYDMIDRDGKSVQNLLEDISKSLVADKTSQAWTDYKHYCDLIIVDGLRSTIKISLQYLLNNTTGDFLKSNDLAPFFDSKLELNGTKLTFNPSFAEEEETNFVQSIRDLVDDIYKVSTIIPRITDNEKPYSEEMLSFADLTTLRDGVLSNLISAVNEARTFGSRFEEYSYLWTENRNTYLDKIVREANSASIPLDRLEVEIRKFESIQKTIQNLEAEFIFKGWLRIDCKPLKSSLAANIKRWVQVFTNYLADRAVAAISEVATYIKDTRGALGIEIKEGDYNGLVQVMGTLISVKGRTQYIDDIFEPLKKTVNLVKQYNVDIPDEAAKSLNKLPEEWTDLKKQNAGVRENVASYQAIEVESLQKKANRFEMKNHEFREEFKKKAPFKYEVGHERAYDIIDECHARVTEMEAENASLRKVADLFELGLPTYKQLNDCRREVGLLKSVWDLTAIVTYMFDSWKSTLWSDIDIDALDVKCRDLGKEIKKLDKEMKSWDVYIGLDSIIKNMVVSLRAVGELRNEAIRDRHWKQLMQVTGVQFIVTQDMKFQDLLKLNLHNFEDDVKTIVDRATKELSMEKVLKDLSETWSTMEFTFDHVPAKNIHLIKPTEELIEALEDNQVMLQNLMTSKYIAYFVEQVSKWQNSLSSIDSVNTIWLEVQKTWSHLESIFKGSEDIRQQLPEDTKRFDSIDDDYRNLMSESLKTPNCVQLCSKKGIYELLEKLQNQLALCEKALAEYLETKRLAFPRFYFVSASDLLDILAKGNQPLAVAVHLSKLFDNIARLEFEKDANGEFTKKAIGMYSKEDEYVAFSEPCDCVGAVETWLNRLVDTMRKTLRSLLSEAVVTYEEKPREQWIFDYAAQIALAGTQIWWTTEVNVAFGRLEEGYENALKDYYKKQCSQLTTLITLIQGQLSKNDRQMIMTICTLDVHARDVVNRMIGEKAENAQCFSWQSQLRFKWDEEEKDCVINICDAHFHYTYEYLGNTPRLVVTPLTDRCYITLTQALHLIMGGAPAGPAGTGKTETTKDLGRSLAVQVYVFNCSSQMDFRSVGNIFKGLSLSGCWGCFDEFNRIAVEVLSVVATQVKSIQDALRAKKKRFIFQGEEIGLSPTIGIFITMNPGYAGRTELPDNLKALFRPCSMVVPDLELICEIMLMAEGFVEASILAKKFVTLYKLNRELLSKQDHYDWALRAIKSVLVVAGSLKRSDPKCAEEQVLMRALRDFNLPKIVSDDVQVFLGLIGDLFPKVEVNRKRNETFEDVIRKAAVEGNLQPEESFILKVVQLEELLVVRHCVMVLGNAGTGKSQIWKTLARSYNLSGRKCTTQDLNPKAITTDELFGFINPSTREWKDGLFSSIMRDLASVPNTDPKWIILDDNIDPDWIESLNTVMDDNKILTLASNERIPLKPHMRLIFEVGDLKNATPATVSRAGILYVNPTDLGWWPFVTSWLDKREDATEKSTLNILFDKYVNVCLDALNSGRFKRAKVENFSMVQTLCNILEALLVVKNVPKGCDKEWYEIYFVFAAIWAFGGTLFQDQLVDYRIEFSKWWVNEFKQIKLPIEGTIFDYYVDNDTKKFMPWTDKITAFIYDSEKPLQSVMVPNAETVRIRYFLDLMLDAGKPMLLIGGAGCGKTVMVQDKLASYGEDRRIVNIPFNYYTAAWTLQPIMEKYLDKIAGRNYGPPGNKKLVYFIDDLNMAQTDKYSTVSPHCLLRQVMDYKHWYDRQKLFQKDIHNIQFVACMNPTAGTFNITTRLARHFSSFSVNFPYPETLQNIYVKILNEHLTMFPGNLQKLSERIISSTLAIHKKISATFLPTAIKFHYIFNLRDLSNIFQGVLFSSKDSYSEPVEFVRLWMHEVTRVYNDKLIDQNDRDQLIKIIQENVKKSFEDLNQTALNRTPLMYCHFAGGMGDAKYKPVKDWPNIKQILETSLEAYNESNAAMNLVLFEDAMSHIARISRIIESSRGNALLVGVGGSGKQSLARLAAYISSFDVFQITLRKGYSVADLKTDLSALYLKTGLKKTPIVFLMTDSQIADEKFLVLINDLLASGNIPGLFDDETFENILNGMRPQAKTMGVVDTRENLWDIFINNVRRYLKVVLCFSPVGNTLRNRARKFPSLINNTTIDWFQEWPQEALISVANRFIQTFDLIPNELRDPITVFMAYAHTSVNETGKKYRDNEKRHTYTTPKSFLEFINLYRNMLEKKAAELTKGMDRLENGLAKLKSTAAQVDDLKARLATQEVELKIKNEEANRLIARVAIDTEKVNKEKAIADEEEQKVAVIAKDVGEKQRSCMADLSKAEPVLKAALDALNTLNKNNLTELKSFATPPPDLLKVIAAVMILLAPPGKVVKDRSWKAAKNMMSNVGAFLESLVKFDKEHIDPVNLQELSPFLKDPEFNADFIKSKSLAAAGLCAWVINIVQYYLVYCDVEPKRLALEKANADLSAAQTKLGEIKGKIAELDKNLGQLREQYETAIAEKLKAEQESQSTQTVISLANRLVGGLASENVRWAEAVGKYKVQESTLAGDVLLASAFLSYVGPFSKKYRQELWEVKWIPYLKDKGGKIPFSGDVDLLNLLTTTADIAKWNNEGLPNDRVSLENATMMLNCKRWPLLIDPQLQGVTWVKNREGANLKIVRLGQRGYLDAIEKAIAAGDCVLIEDVGTWIDPVLDPLIGRNLIKKGRYIKLGDKEIEYDPKFRLILQTRYANPHYPPEIQAQTTLINFTVTLSGLEDQLLVDVVNSERPDLERTKADLTKQQNEFKIKLMELENNLLFRLSSAEGNFLGDTSLVDNLENTKKTALEIEQKVAEAKITEKKINETREIYRPVATRSSLLYFLLNDMNQMHPMYQFSLNSYKVVFLKAIATAETSEDVKERIKILTENITFCIWRYTVRGLFERDKLIFTAQMVFQILISLGELNLIEYDFLLRAPKVFNVNSPVDWISHSTWGTIKALSNLEEFKMLANDIEGAAKRWQKYCEVEAPENEKLPQEWKNKNALQKLCILRALRPDRMIYALRDFIGQKVGNIYVDAGRVPLAKSFEEAGPATPVFFILSPGVDPVKEVETLGRQFGFTTDNGKFFNVSLGQGQEIVAEQRLDHAYQHGCWVMLENIHLVARWLPTLEKKLESLSTGSHADFRVFLSAEPAGDPSGHIIPISILQNSIKITNEPPSGMKANLHRALDNFSQETLERCSKENEFKSILFALCYFHAVVVERKKFGSQGWNRSYPFSTGDLSVSSDVLYNYLEASVKVPWTDLRYMFGDILYGGHISDNWDRRLCSSYLEVYVKEELLEAQLEFAPGFMSPASMDYKEYHKYIDESLPQESPNLYGLHPNAEITVLTKMGDRLFQTMLEMQPKDTGSALSVSREEKVKQVLDEILEKLPDSFNVTELMARVEERTPFVNVALQECDRMSTLTDEIRRSLKELNLGLKGDLTISEAMEALMNSIYLNQVPISWERLAYPSMCGLAAWFSDLLLRIKELEQWVAEFQLPSSVWLPGLFNPQSFLTAIMQTTARKNEWPLDKMALTVDVLKKGREEITAAPREGAFIHGLYIEGCKWDSNSGCLAESNAKELIPAVPVLYVRAVPIDKRETKGIYECPVYATRGRGPTYIWTFGLKTKEKPAKWTLAGVSLLLSNE